MSAPMTSGMASEDRHTYRTAAVAGGVGTDREPLGHAGASEAGPGGTLPDWALASEIAETRYRLSMRTDAVSRGLHGALRDVQRVALIGWHPPMALWLTKCLSERGLSVLVARAVLAGVRT